MTKFLFPAVLSAAVFGLLAIPAEACNPGVPASSFSYGHSYNTCNTVASTYVAPAASVYYAYPLQAIVAIPTVAVAPAVVQPTVPAPVPPQAPQAPQAAPQPAPQQEAAALAPLTYTVPQASVVVQRQFYTTYGLAAAPVITQSYAYGGGVSAGVFVRDRSYRPAETVVINRGRTLRAGVGRTPVIVQKQRRFAPIRNAIARKQAARGNGGVPASQVIIRR